MEKIKVSYDDVYTNLRVRKGVISNLSFIKINNSGNIIPGETSYPILIASSEGKFGGDAMSTYNTNNTSEREIRYCKLDRNSNHPLNMTFTLSVWAKPIISIGSNGTQIVGARGGQNLYAYSEGSDNKRFLYNTYQGALYSSIGVTINKWYHFAITCDSTTVRLFIDGNLCSLMNITTSSSKTIIDFANFFIGTNMTNTTPVYYDDLVILNNICLWTDSFTIPTTYLDESIIQINNIPIDSTMSPKNLKQY